MPIHNPTATARGLDHLVIVVHDLDEAAARWERMGFRVGTENVHPFGTKNRLIQLPGFFIELLGNVAQPPKLHFPDSDFLFPSYNRDWLARLGEGPSMLVLESGDAAADARAFAAASIGQGEPFFFERKGRAPDGSERRVAFTLAFARDEAAPDAGFFVCQQHFPENFWSPETQVHANGASEVQAVVMTAENPSDHHVFLTHFTGQRDMTSTSSGVTFDLPRGAMEVLIPLAFKAHFGVEVDDRPRLRALRLGVRDMDSVANLLKNNGIEAFQHNGHLVVPPAQANGAVVVFTPAVN